MTRQQKHTLAQHAAYIREHAIRTADKTAEVGRRLSEVKEIVGPGNLGKWLRAEFQWSQAMGYLYIKTYEVFGKHPWMKNIQQAAAFRLVAKAVPVSLRNKVIAMAKRGTLVRHRDVLAMFDSSGHVRSKQGGGVKPRQGSIDSLVRKLGRSIEIAELTTAERMATAMTLGALVSKLMNPATGKKKAA